MGNMDAQVQHPVYQEISFAPHSSQVFTKPTNTVNNPKNIIWNETFDIGSTGSSSTPGPTFTTSNGAWTTGGVDGNVWKHSFYTTSGEWSLGAPPFTSTTASDGFMLFDSDSVNFPISPNYVALSGELISPPINLTTQTSAMLTIEQAFRFCCGSINQTTVSVSSDNGATWGTPYNYAESPEGLACGGTGDPFEASINISGEAAGNTILLKFNWDGNTSGSSHYYWTIDDISIATIPDHDVQLISSWIYSENNGGIQYGRTPEDQQDVNYRIGTEIYNIGALDQTNVTSNCDYTGVSAFNSVGVDALLKPDSTVTLEQIETLSLSAGTYTGVHTVTMDSIDLNMVDNTATREFEITLPASNGNTTEYSMDGIGVYTQDVVIGSLGTDSFTGGEDSLVAATLYNIKTACSPIGIRVILATGTVAGGEIYGSIKDSSTFWADDMTSLFQTDGSPSAVTVTSADINAGYKDLYFPSAPTLSPGVVYAAIEMHSNSNSFDIRIQDDETVTQPFDASAIYIAGDQSYTNGNALGIRLLFGFSGIEENSLEGVSVYPNPSEGVVTITNDNSTNNSITVTDVSGKLILTKAVSTATIIDLSSNGSGIYLVTVSSENGSMVERVVIH